MLFYTNRPSDAQKVDGIIWSINYFINIGHEKKETPELMNRFNSVRQNWEYEEPEQDDQKVQGPNTQKSSNQEVKQLDSTFRFVFPK